MPRTGIQLAYPFEEKRLLKWQPPFIIQPKYDGDRCRALPIADRKYLLVSSEENPFFSVPHIVDAVNNLGLDIEFDGELYCHGMKHEEIHSIVSRTVNLHPNHKEIKFHIFDYVSEETQMERLISLSNMKHTFKSPYLTLAPFHLAETFEDVMRIYDDLINKGFEGMIVRHFAASYVRKRSVYMMKFKPKKEDIYEIIDLVEETSISGVPKEALGAFVVKGSDGTPFKVGTGFTREHRRNLWERGEVLKGKTVRISYQHLTAGKKVPRFPVFVEVIEDG